MEREVSPPGFILEHLCSFKVEGKPWATGNKKKVYVDLKI